jgi:hypothetical protein
MLAAALIASLWAQAEQAPAPTPAAPPPPTAAAQPPGPPPPVIASPGPPSPPNGVSVHARFAYRVGAEGKSLGPAAGFSLGGTFERRYLGRGTGLELGAAVDFFYDRFSTAVLGADMDASGQPVLVPGDRTLSQTSFSLLQTAGWRATDVRLFAAAGPGLTIGYFSSPEADLRPGNKTAAQPLAHGVVGFEFALSALTAAVLRVDYTHPFTRPTFTASDGTKYSLFGDIFDAGVGLLVRF